jgi:hypothetical protein
MPASPPNRGNIIISCGRIVRGSFSTQDQQKFAIELEPLQSDVLLNGEIIGRRWISSIARLRFIGDGRMTSGLIAAYNQFANMRVGASVFDSADTPTTIHVNDGGSTHILQATNFTRLGDLVYHPEERINTAHEITGIVANTKAFTEAASFWDVSGSSTFEDSGFTSAAVVSQLYTCALATGPTGFTSFQCEKGVRAQIDLGVEPWRCQGMIRDYRFQRIGVMVRGIPVEPTFAQIQTAMKMSGSGAVPGREEAASAYSLTITGDVTTTAHLTVPLASLVTTSANFSGIDLRNGECGFYGSRPYTAGVRQALFTVA